jgi:hypothetical protein
MPAQFSLRRLVVAITLVGVGCGELSFLIASRPLLGPLGATTWIAIVTCPMIMGAGLLMPIKRPILGAFLGLLCLPVLLFLLWGGQD